MIGGLGWQELLIVMIIFGIPISLMVGLSNSNKVEDSQKSNRYKHPLNGYTEEISSVAWLWVLLFGPIYWAIKGVWSHVVIHAIFGFFTFGFAHLIYPFFASSILRTHYLKKGWKPE